MPLNPDTKPQQTAAGCLAIAAVFLLLGIGGTSLFAVRAWRDVRIFTVWAKTTCVIVAKDLASSGSSGRSKASYRPDVTFRYTVGGREYTCTGWDSWALVGDYGGGSYKYYERALDRYDIGASYPCWYDPADPAKAVLVRRIRPLYVLSVLPLAFMLLGATALSSLLGKAKQPVTIVTGARNAAEHGQDPSRLWDYQRLAVRLEPVSSPGSQSCGAVGVSLPMLFIAGIAGYAAWADWQDGSFPAFPLLFVVVFGGLGLLFLWIGAAAAIASRVPATIVEVDRRSVQPGGTVDVLLLQPGPLRLRSLRVRLTGTLETPATSGSPVVTSLHDEVVTEVGPTTIGAAGPLEHRATVHIPPDALPSRTDGKPRVAWRLEVWGVPLVWPRFKLDFPIVVTDPHDETRRAGDESTPSARPTDAADDAPTP